MHHTNSESNSRPGREIPPPALLISLFPPFIMTRANLNFVWQNPGEAPRTLFHYHNGDQYPEGLLQFFGIEAFLTLDRLWTPDDFRSWIRTNYRRSCRQVTQLANGVSIDSHAETNDPAEPEDLGENGQPRIYYTDGFATDYSYLFTHHYVYGRKRKDGTRPFDPVNWVSVWNFKKLVFDGSAKRFLRSCEKRVQPRVVPGESASFSAVSAALAKAFSQ